MHCPICNSETNFVGKKRSYFLENDFILRRCNNCYFAFVENPCKDYEKIYNEEYYMGCGADPLVNYVQEMEKPSSTIRNLEWEALQFFIEQQTKIKNILDYGCGNGLAANFLNKRGYFAEGWDIGWLAKHSKERGLPILTENPIQSKKKYDLIFAIEVLEHIENPLETIKEIHSLLRPGGIFFLTTGNAMPHWNNLLDWNYFRPEIHISLFTPESLKVALEKSGFLALNHEYSNVFDNIIAYKILKNLRINNLNIREMPINLSKRREEKRREEKRREEKRREEPYSHYFAWNTQRMLLKILSPILRYIDTKYGVSAMPYGVAK